MAAEAIVGSLLGVLTEKGVNTAIEELKQLFGAEEEVRKLSEMLVLIQAMLRNAEERQLVEEGVQLWLADLKDIARQADDVLDEFSTKAAARRLMQEARAKLRRGGQPSAGCFNLTAFCGSVCLIPSRHRIASEIKAVAAKMVEFKNKGELLKLVIDSQSTGAINLSSQRETGSLLVGQFFGRETDEERIMEMLLSDFGDAKGESYSSSSSIADRASVSILSIVGMGGTGKTTLAQAVYDSAQSHFSMRKWLYVGENFDAKGLIKKILGQEGERTLDMLSQDLIHAVEKKRFLFVLDDVWCDKSTELEKLLGPLRCGGQGSKVLVTTRSLKVAQAMGKVKLYHLMPLSDEACWFIFANRAFSDVNSTQPRLEEIGREIVKNLKGVPLAAKIIGSMLGNTNSVEEWRRVLENGVWSSQLQNEDLIEQVVGLSYRQLPPCLKQCFAHCAMFPKGFHFQKTRLVQMWMAQGFVEDPKVLGGGDRLEDVGSDYFEHLVRSSFFQQEGSTKELPEQLQAEEYMANVEQTYVMHDIVHSLAQSISRAECWFTGEKNLQLPEKPCHMSFSCATTNSAALTTLSEKFPNLRSLVHCCGHGFISFVEFPLLQVLDHLRCIRVLDLKGCLIRNLPDSVGELIHLRYLDVTDTGILELPASLCNLHNLQTLRWTGGGGFPKGTSRLVNLRCLDGDKWRVHNFPRIGRLTALQELKVFQIKEESGYRIGELADMAQLRGMLSITNLENVTGGGTEAALARLRDKKYLRSLNLWWNLQREGVSTSHDQDLEVAEGLEPHPGLEDIEIYGNMGERPPSWIANGRRLSNLVSAGLQKCPRWSSLPALGALRHLKSLKIGSLTAVKAVGHEFYGVDEHGSTDEPPFPRLETLVFYDMPEWEAWSIPEASPHRCPPFPILRALHVVGCPKLTALPPLPPSVAELTVYDVGLGGGVLSDSGEATPSVPCSLRRNFTSVTSLVRHHSSALEKLTIKGYKGELASLLSGGDGSLAAVKFLDIQQCSGLTAWPEPDSASLGTLSSLELSELPNLTAISEVALRCLTTLHVLHIHDCHQLSVVGLQGLVSLERLEILRCPKLTRCPEGSSLASSSSLEVVKTDVRWLVEWLLRQPGGLPSLTELIIAGCAELVSFGEEEERGLASLTKLTTLEISSCRNLTVLPDAAAVRSMTALREFSISHCSRLRTVPLQGLVSLRHLKIQDCNQLARCLEGSKLPSPSSLESVSTDVRWLLEWLLCHHSLCSLQTLEVDGCDELISFSVEEEKGLAGLTSLRRLRFCSCDNLQPLPSRIIRALPLLAYVELNGQRQIDPPSKQGTSSKCLSISRRSTS